MNISLIEKSGSVAAMHEHGLPVISVSTPWQNKKNKKATWPTGVSVYRKGNLESILNSKQPPEMLNGAPVVAKALVDALLTV
jgi:hypothetical protein